MNYPYMLLAITALAMFVCGCASPLEYSAETDALAAIKTIAPLPMVDAPGAEGGYSGNTVASILSQKLMTIKGFRILEREKFQAIIMERDLKASDLVADPAVAAQVGGVLGADAVMTGSVTEYNSSSIPIFLGLFTHYADVYKVGISVRLVPVETGAVCFSAHHTETGSSYQEAASKCADAVINALNCCYQKENKAPL